MEMCRRIKPLSPYDPRRRRIARRIEALPYTLSNGSTWFYLLDRPRLISVLRASRPHIEACFPGAAATLYVDGRDLVCDICCAQWGVNETIDRLKQFDEAFGFYAHQRICFNVSF